MNDRIEGAARELGGRAQQKIGEAVGDAKTQADGLYNQAAGRVQQVMGHAQDATESLSSMIRSQPLVAAFTALGVGYLLGRLRI